MWSGLLWGCTKIPELCTTEQLCRTATIVSASGSTAWLNQFSTASKFVKEAKKRRLSCGVKTKTASVKNKTASVKKVCSRLKLDGCTDEFLCKVSTRLRGHARNWRNKNTFYEREAKKRGLTCGVGEAKTTAVNKNAELKKVFYGLSTLEHKQMQYALKKLGYYQSTVDGIWGRKTLGALSSFIRKERIKSRNALFNLTEMVNVPSSFAVAKRPSTSSSSSSSSNSSSGLTAIVSSPSVPANQAIAICEPMASQAASNAENSYSAPKTKKSYRGKCKKDYFGDFDCSVRDSTSSGGFAAGFANAASGWLDGRKAGSRAYKSCLASYGWRKN